ncbi:hypothetical protein PT974_09773 [Cladobotryum mycophilum]|uniref:DUF6536 domain-containing protein n=1 Tax=Cladobotryum mycophilum TaxID=491253 RepID=A0ABR0SIA7_9HYPO
MDSSNINNPYYMELNDFDESQNQRETSQEPLMHAEIHSQDGHHDGDSSAGEEEQPLMSEKQPYKLPQYAKINVLSRYIPELEPEHARAQTLRVRMGKRATMLMVQSIIAFAVIVANLGLCLWAILARPPDFRGIGTVYLGDCGLVTRIDSIAHLVLNLISSLFLGAGNYCMQILVAPSREEVDRAHATGHSMDIGLHSMRNLRRIDVRRVALWAAIGFASILLHLFWNAAVFASLPFVPYPIAITTSDFLRSNDTWGYDKLYGLGDSDANNGSSVFALHHSARNYTRINVTECIDQYIDPLQATADLVVIASNLTAAQNNGSSLLNGWMNGNQPTRWDGAGKWICSVHEDQKWTKYCSPDWAKEFSHDWELATTPPIKVAYCLVGPAGDNDQRCGLHYNTYTLSIVCLLTIIEGFLIGWTWMRHSLPTLVTMGDAVASFLGNPERQPVEEDTDDDNNNSTPTKWGTRTDRKVIAPVVHTWNPKARVIWLSGADRQSWILALVGTLVILGIAILLLCLAIRSFKIVGVSTTIRGLVAIGFGTVNSASLVGAAFRGGSGTANFFLTVLFANIFQLLVSLAYVLWNNVLTQQLVADSMVRFLRADGKKPLRVSSPRGMQRSSYILSLPMLYSGPMMICFIILHWLVSQSVFNVQTIAFQSGPGKTRIPTYDASRIGFSALGILVTILFGGLFFIILVTNSLVRTYKDVPKDFPRLATDSNAIRCLCQPPLEDTDAEIFPVRLGVVPADNGKDLDAVPRLAFSTLVSISGPQAGGQYLQPKMVPLQSKRGTKR